MDYDDIAEEYLKAQEEFYKTRPDIPTELIIDKLEVYPGREYRLLELGCGKGNIQVLNRKYIEGEYIGIDRSGRMLPTKRSGTSRMKIPDERGGFSEFSTELHYCFYQLDFDEGLPFKSGDIDRVFSRYALHYSRNLNPLFGEISRVLKPKGRVVAVVAHPVLGFELKKEKDYWKNEEVEVVLYDGAVKIVEPTHTFQEYWDAFAKNRFKIISQEESSHNANLESKLRVPDYYFFVLEKE